MSFFRLPSISTATVEPYKNYRGHSQATRIDRREEMHGIVTLVEKTRDEVALLEKAWKSAGAADLSYNKYPIMQHLLNLIDEKITEFNDGDQEDELSKEHDHINQLISELEAIVKSFSDDKVMTANAEGQQTEVDGPRLAVIKAKRNDDKSKARTIADVGLVGGVAALAVVANVSFLAGMFYCGLAGAAGRVMSKKYNLDSDDTESHALLKNFLSQFAEVRSKIMRENSSPVPN